MILSPPLQANSRVNGVRFQDIEILNSEISASIYGLRPLFERSIPSDNSFGANEVWNFFTQQRLGYDIFFPDVGIFSTKTRLVDLFHRPFYGCYSDFNLASARKTLSPYGISGSMNLVKTSHPYRLIEEKWDNSTILRDLALLKDSGLLFLPKSTAAIERNFSSDALHDAINRCRKHADRVTLCIYYADWKKYADMDLPAHVSLVTCGSRFDVLFYFRLNLLVKAHRFIAFFEPGSHTLFASLSGKPQLHIPTAVSKTFLRPEQMSRYPDDNDLGLFKEICSQQLNQIAPVHAPGFKIFFQFEQFDNDELLALGKGHFLKKKIAAQLSRRIFRTANRLKFIR